MNTTETTLTTTTTPVRPTVDRHDFFVDNGVVRPRYARYVPTNRRVTSTLRQYMINRRTNDAAGLSDDSIRAVAPSVFADRACEATTSERYAFFPTSDVLAALRREGWVVAEATQSRASEVRQGFQQHQLRLRHPLLKPNTQHNTFVEAILRNSHDGSCAKNLNLGLWRQICSNGLTVSEASFASLRFTHRGQTQVHDVLEQAADLIARAPAVHEVVQNWSQRRLTPAEQLEFAVQAWQLRWDADSTAPVRPESLLFRRRYEDCKPTLWHVYNAVQENLLQGGFRDGSRTGSGRRQSARGLTGVDAQRLLNVGLWDLAHGMAAGSVQPDASVISLVG